MIDYEQKDNVVKLKTSYTYNLILDINSSIQNIPCILPI